MAINTVERRTLEEFNPWWLSSSVDAELALPFKRDLYAIVEKSLEKRFMLALVGLRRVGKTTLLYQLIEKLLADAVPPTNIFFFSFDETAPSLSAVINAYQEAHHKEFRQQRTYFFFDEVQKCRNWENEIKKYYDLYPKMKFILSGSESLFIRKKTKENLAGRIFEFFLEPFNFKEYLTIKGIPPKEWSYETRIKPLFHEYALKGGFPETFSLETDKKFKEYVRSLVVDKIIYKDIPRLFRIDDPEFLLTLLELICSNPGMDVDYQSWSQQLGKDRRVIKDYLFYLKESFLIRMLGNYRKGRMATLRKKKRVYPTDTALIYLYRSQQDAAFFGKVVETVVANKLHAALFWKNGHDVDFVDDKLPIEVKYQEQITAEDLKGIREFMKKFAAKVGIVITKNEKREITTDNGKIRLIPVWKWLLLE